MNLLWKEAPLYVCEENALLVVRDFVTTLLSFGNCSTEVRMEGGKEKNTEACGESPVRKQRRNKCKYHKKEAKKFGIKKKKHGGKKDLKII